jgi:pyruvate dehydrogenase E1 component alpha subunit
LPLATGAALAIKQRKGKDVAICFFGDGAQNEGAFHESLNMAAVWKLPVVYVCENNQYGMSVSTVRSTAVKDVATRAVAYNMPGVIVDGNSVADVNEAVSVAVERARNGEGPSLIECKTYRTKGHSRSDRNRYRTKDEIEAWKNKDPIPAFESELEAHGIANRGEIDAIREAVEKEIQDSFEFATKGTNPTPDSLLRGVTTTGDIAMGVEA